MFFAKQHHKKGFTLAETILVVAIIAILLAVAAPNVLAYYRQLKLTGLDDDAKTIFMAAQSRLTAMLSAGEDLKPTGTGSGEGKSSESGVEFFYITKSDIAGDNYDGLHNYVPGGSIESQLQENNFIVEFVPRTGAVHAVWYWENDNDNFTYKSNYDADAISRDTRLDEMVGYYGGKGIDRPALGQLPIPELNIINAEELRLDIKVSKEQIEKALSSGTALDYNKGIFTVDIYVNDADSKMMRIVKDAPLKYNAAIDATSLTGSVVLGTLHTEPDRYKGTTLGDRYYIDGKKFKDWKDLDDGNKSIIYIDPVTLNGNPLPVDYNDKGIHAGNDITVTVVLKCKEAVTLTDGSTRQLISQSASAQTNSLFAGLEDNGDGTKTALIAYGRHLQNLHDSGSNTMSEGGFSSGVLSNSDITAAKQIRDINFYKTAESDEDPIYYWGSTYKKDGGGTGYDAYEAFHPISNANILKFDGDIFEIRNMCTEDDNGASGLFSSVYNEDNTVSFCNITIVNPNIHGHSAGGRAGALASDVFSKTRVIIDNCKVYVDFDEKKDIPDWEARFNNLELDNLEITKNVSGKAHVDLLDGLPHIGAPESNSSAGGLIGTVWADSTVEISDSFSSISVIGENCVGGLVGNVGNGDNINIGNSYSASFLFGKHFLGGFLGHVTTGVNLNLTNSYVAGEIKLDMTGWPVAAGFFTRDDTYDLSMAHVENCYSAVKYDDTTGEIDPAHGGQVYGTYRGDDTAKNYYIADPDITAGYGNQEGGSTVECGKVISAADLIKEFESQSGWTVDIANMVADGTLPAAAAAGGDEQTNFTHAYNLLKDMDLKVYPYPMLKTNVEVVNDTGTGTASTDLPVEHYGDWVEGEDTPSATMVYYETTAGGTNVYGFYKNEDGSFKTTPESSLHTGSDDYVIKDGYALSYPDGTDVSKIPDKITIDGDEHTINKSYFATAPGGDKLYRIEGIDSVKRDKYYHKVEVPVDNTASADVTVFWFNPDLACEVFPDELMKESDGTKIDEADIPMHQPLKKEGRGADVGDGVAVVRSARQLAQLGINTNAGTDYSKMLQKLKYEQKMDIDFLAYTGTMPTIPQNAKSNYNHIPITLIGESGSAKASYNGNDHVIRNMESGTVKDGDFAESGLFGKIQYADIMHIELINPRVVLYDGDNAAQVVPTSGTTTRPTVSAPKILDAVELNGKTFTIDEQYTSDDGFTVLPRSGYAINITTGEMKWESNGSTYTGEYRFDFGGPMSDTNRAIKFHVEGAATVKVWWGSKNDGSGGNNRQLRLNKVGGSTVGTTNITIEKDTPYFKVFQITEKGDYVLGSADSGNIIYRIEVYEGEVPTDEKDSRIYNYDGSSGYPYPVENSGASGGSIPAGAKVRVGALAGIVDSSTVTDCGAYVDENTNGYTDIDKAYDQFIVKNSFVSSQPDAVGGLVGNIATNSKVKECYSAVKVVGLQKAGGFAGRIADNSEIKDCYVGGHTSEGTYIKLDSFGELKNSEYFVNVSTENKDKQTYTGGFVGETDNTVKYGGVCYTTASVGMAYNTFRGSDKKTISTMGQFAGTGDVTKAGSDTTLYASGSTFRKVEDNTKTDTEDKKDYEYFPLGTKTGIQDDTDTKNKKDLYAVRDEKYLNQAALVNDGGTLSAKETKYDKSLGENYPYKVANGQKEHHGDWTNRFQFIYYEVYDKDYVGEANLKNKLNAATDSAAIQKAVGFYAQIKDMRTGNPTWVNTLHTEDPVLDSGYMILANSKDSKIIFSISSFYGEKQNAGSSTYFTNADAIPGTNIKDQNSNQIAEYLYVIPFEAINLAPSTTYYLKVNINGQPYMLNPFFACEAINVDLLDADGELDYNTIREKKDLTYTTYKIDHATGTRTEAKTTTTFKKGDDAVIIRNAWNLAGMARYTRDGNEDDNAQNKAQKYNYHVLMDIDYQTYANGERIYDGNTNARGEKDGNGNYHEWYSGNKDGMGQVSASLNGGTFNGYGHTITNFFLGSDRGEDKYVGLFGSLTGGSKVENLMIEGLKVNTYGEHSSDSIVSAIAAVVDGKSTVNDIYIDGVDFNFDYKDHNTNKEWVENNNKPGTVSHVGGIVGQLKSGTVSDVTVNSVTIDFNARIGDGYKGSSIKDPDTKKPDGGNGGKAISIGGAIGEIDCSGTGAGASVSNVTVIDPTITANRGKDNKVGGFVGSVADSSYAVYSNTATGVDDTRPAEIKNCGVYISDGKKDDFINMGVIANGDPTDRTTSDGDKVGGFAGYLGLGANVTGDYSAIRVQGIKYAGGFAGYIKGSHVKDCYSGGYVNDTTKDYDTNYNVVADTSDGTAGGFVGYIRVAYQNGSSGPMAMYMTGINYTTSSVSGKNVGLFAGDGTDDAAKALAEKMGNLKPTNYAGGKAYNDAARKESTVKIKSAMPRKDKTGTTFTTTSYNVDKTKVFPFDTNLTEHHGDWVEYDLMTAGYWELEDNLLRIYYIPSDLPDSPQERMESGCEPFDHDGRHTDANYEGITKAGYFAAWANDSGKTYSLTGNISTPTEDTAIESRIQALLGGSTITVKAYDNAKSASASLETWQITGGTTSSSSIEYYVNPAYGRAIEIKGTTTSELGTEKKPYEIRTAQQLDNADGNGMYFRQTHDVVGKKYNGYTPNNLSGGEYDGGSYRILDLKIDAGSDNAALFSALNSGARVVNTILYGTTTGTSEPTISGKNAAGIAATIGNNSNTDFGEATIENCAVAGYKITGTANVGGLVATVTGGTHVIKNSQASADLMLNYSGTDGGTIGGLVGNVGSAGKLKVQDSYAGGTANVNGDPINNEFGTTKNENFIFAGGIVGKIRGEAISVTADPDQHGKEKPSSGNQDTSGNYKTYYYSYAFDEEQEITYDNVYSFLDMYNIEFHVVEDQKFREETESGGKYSYSDKSIRYNDDVIFSGIGPNVNDRDANIGYWDGGMPDKNVADRERSMSLLELADMNTANKAEKTYIPDNGTGNLGLTDRQTLSGDQKKEFPFKEYVQEDGKNVHYGAWPEAASYAGIFYYEKESGKYNFYAYGIELVNGTMRVSEILDTLCKERHLDEVRGIDETGYGYFVTDDSINFSVTGGTSPFTFDEDTTDTIGNELITAIGYPEPVKVMLMTDNTPAAEQGLYATYKDLEWTLTTNAGSFGLHVIPAFGGAIYGDEFIIGTNDDDHPEQDSPFAARTPEQFMNITKNHRDGSVDYYIISHDINFSDVKDYTPGPFGGLVLDGQGYRLFNLNITTDGEGYKDSKTYSDEFDSGNTTALGAALFTSDKSNTKTLLKNIVLYAPKGDGEIKSNSNSAAGIVVNHIRGTIENCVVAGYTITGAKNVGGITAESNHVDNKITDCEAVNKLVGTVNKVNVGGIVGIVTGAKNGSIQNCYSGGTVDVSGVTDATVGGIYGSNAKDKNGNYENPKVKNSYTYMGFNNSTLTGADVYTLGKTAKLEGNNYYYDKYANSVTGINTQGIKAEDKNLTGTWADNSYWPRSTADDGYVHNAMGRYPFRAVAYIGDKDDPDMYVHYGVWPNDNTAQAAGVAYYEKDSNGKYYVQIIGYKSDDGSTFDSVDDNTTLCTERHVDATTGNISTEHQIVESGYAAFTTNPGTLKVGDGCELTGIGAAVTGNGTVANEVSAAIDRALDVIIPMDGIKVYPTGETGNTENMSAYNATVTAGGNTRTVYYTNGFAGVSKDVMGTSTSQIKIRTVRQLDNIPDSCGKYFQQTHDLYGEDYKNGSTPKYTGATGFSGNYDGGSYRILELSMSGSGEGIGLFNTASGTIENVIMYSPSGNANITNRAKSNEARALYGVGGIVGKTKNSGLEISHSIVAGYTITGCDAVGGIVGDCYYGADISNSAAVNVLVGSVTDSGGTKLYASGMGGIAGASDTSSSTYKFKVNTCYAGGTIKEAGSDTKVGGILGCDTYVPTDATPDEYPTIKGSYSYVNLKDTGASAANVNTIGGNLLTTGTGDKVSKDNYYLNGLYPAGSYNVQGDGKDYFEIAGMTTADNTADRAYAPDTTDPAKGLEKTTYPFPAVVKDKGNDEKLVHYGALPEVPKVNGAVNGIFYWEKHGEVYHVQTIAVAQDGTDASVDNLCTNRDGTGVSESGFGYFTLDGTAAIGTNHGDEIVDTDVVGKIKTALGVHNAVKVHAYKNGTTAGDEVWSFTEANGTKRDTHVNPASAKVTSSAVSNAYEIRSYSQLALMNTESGKINFTQAHDIDASASSSGSPYTPATLPGNTTYDGGGFRILELTITSTGDDVGLFANATGGGSTVKNVVMYSPSGTATIKGGKNVGGIIGSIDKTIKISNCVVSGYTISGTNYVGGIVGDFTASGGSDTIENCVAVNKLSGEGSDVKGIGGITGFSKRAIKNCYAGGTITATGDTIIGGINGEGNDNSTPIIANCYSYVSLNHSTASKAYAITGLGGSNYNGVTGCYYLESDLPTGGTAQGNKLTASTTLTGFSTVNSSYAPQEASMDGGVTGSGTLGLVSGNSYPYPAVFSYTDESGDKHYEHYGTWLGTMPSSVPWGEFGIFLVYDDQNLWSGISNASAVGVAFGIDSNGKLTVTRKGTNTGISGNNQIAQRVGFFVKTEHVGQISKIAESVAVEFYSDMSRPNPTPVQTFNFKQYESNDSIFENKDSEFGDCNLYYSTTNNNQLASALSSGWILVKYEGSEIGRFQWKNVDPSKTDPISTTSSNPGMPEGPSFEGMMSAAVPEGLMPEVLALPVNELAGEAAEGETGEILPPDTPDAIKPEEFTLPDPESTDDNGDDGHTEIIDIRVSVARVRRVR